MASTMGIVRQLLYGIVPSYLQNRQDDKTEPSTKRYATSALDGLRGIAALFVFIFHILFAYTDLVEFGYGRRPEHTRLIQLPFIRLFHSGHAMVIVFFVIGGYVFSLKPLKLLRSGHPTAFMNSLVSSAFKRGIRLYAPAVIATFVTMITLYTGLWEYQRQFMREDRSIIWYADNHLDREISLDAQVLHWITQTIQLTNFIAYVPTGIVFQWYPQYDPHLWTIPIEYRSSMLLALLLFTISSCKPAARFAFLLTSTCFAIVWGRWELVCFIAGATLCDIDLATNAFQEPTDARYQLKDEESLQAQTSPGAEFQRTLQSQWPQFVSCGVALYLLSTPPLDIAETPGFVWLSNVTPTSYTDPKRWPHTIGTIILVAALGRSPLLRRPFETAFAQYLGKISFSLYIVHGPLIHIVGYRVTPWIWLNVTGMEGWRWTAGLLMGSCILAVVVAVIADLFWRSVEAASVEWARRFEKWCCIEQPGL